MKMQWEEWINLSSGAIRKSIKMALVVLLGGGNVCVCVYMLQMEGRILISNYSTIRMKIKQPHFEWCEIIVELAWI